eukprot:scaffold25295_cov153-Skeletonema_marinoi.AAC.5
MSRHQPSSGGGGGVVPLSKWIHRALDSAVVNYLLSAESTIVDGDMAISSDVYIIPALRVASSLAEQICKVEETSNDCLLCGFRAVEGADAIPAS